MKALTILLFAASVYGQTFTGVVTDTMCGADHKSMHISPDAKCVRECVRKHGAKYALWDGRNLYTLSDQHAPAQFAAQKVKVTGVLHEKTLEVKNIELAK